MMLPEVSPQQNVNSNLLSFPQVEVIPAPRPPERNVSEVKVTEPVTVQPVPESEFYMVHERQMLDRIEINQIRLKEQVKQMRFYLNELEMFFQK